ncbi:DUF4214 domain-containing protein [Halomonas sp. IOP_31]|uniref:DUF4214 domain-containing protein n=1 Tax=Halomonas sp. IOP_31 TaxID=2876584 RepID=UPI001E4ECAC6|nr:DUF4214 domain-containing protein [Halomonas sp. IOP_31]MCD6008527.1 DUF4214 domain-containing protein [Halomonas sp. IOP_31]
MATQANLDLAQQLYVAYYGRPADPKGLTYWADQIEAKSVENVVNAFGTSEEFDARFGDQTNEQLVNNLYNQMFGRNAELEGLNYYSEQLASGESTLAEIALDIANGAQNEDATALSNKVAVADAFTTDIDTTEEVLAYQGTDAAQAARDFLSTVDETTDPAAVNVEAELAELVNNNDQNPGQAFTLTTGIDTSPAFDGGAGDDTYVGTDATYTTGDDLNGGDGSDTLKLVFANANSAAVDLTSIENVSIRDLNGNTVDASAWSGVTSLTNDRSSADVTVQDMAALPSISIVQGNGSDTIVTTTADLSGSADALTVNTTSANVGNVQVSNATTTTDTVEKLTIVNSGDSVIGAVTDTVGTPNLAALTSLSVSGSGSVDLDNSTYSGLTSVDSAGVAMALAVDNSGATAGTDTSISSTGADDSVTLTGANGAAGDAAVTSVSLGDGDNTVSVTAGSSLQEASVETGAGDDTITLDVSAATVNTSTASVTSGDGADTVTVTADADVALTANLGGGDDTLTIDAINATTDVTDAIDAGAGTDTLRATSTQMNTIGADADQVATLSNFEQMAISDGLADDQDLTAFGFDRITLESTVAGAATVTMASGNTIEFGSLGDNAAGGVVTAAVDGASDAGSFDDQVNIEANVDFAGATAFTARVDTAFVETVDVSVTDTDTDTAGTGAATVTLDSANRVDTINVAADQATTVAEGSANFTALNTFDASASSAGVTFSGANASQGVVFTGGTGADVLTGSGYADQMSGGDGKDTLSGGAGNDTIDGGAGADTIDGGAGNDTIDAGAGDDTVKSSAGADSITLGAGSDTVVYGAKADSSSANTDTVTDFTAGSDTLNFKAIVNGAASFNSTAVDVSGAADLSAALDLAVDAQDATTNSAVRFFEWDSNTYVVVDNNDGGGTPADTAGFTDGEDMVVELTGSVAVTADELVLA